MKANQDSSIPSPFKLSDRITCLPVVNGSGNCALAVRKWLLENSCDCLAVGLPESFRSSVLEAVEQLPTPSMVLQQCLQRTRRNRLSRRHNPLRLQGPRRHTRRS